MASVVLSQCFHYRENAGTYAKGCKRCAKVELYSCAVGAAMSFHSLRTESRQCSGPSGDINIACLLRLLDCSVSVVVTTLRCINAQVGGTLILCTPHHVDTVPR